MLDKCVCRWKCAPILILLLFAAGCSMTTPAQARSRILTVSPSSLTFAPQPLNVLSSSQAVVTTNSGTATVSISAVSVSNTAFVVTGPTLPLSLAPGHSVTWNVSFRPASTGTTSGTLSVSSNASSSPAVSLSGSTTTTAAQLTLSATSLNFGSVTVGSVSGTQSVRLANTGTTNVTLSAVSVSTLQFTLLSAPPLPLTLNPGESTGVSLAFAPTVAGQSSGTLTVTSTASPSQNAASLTGSGAQASSGSSGSFSITTTSLHAGYLQQPYGAVLAAGGGAAPYTWSVASGQLPPGLTLSASTGLISGTPSQPGSFSVTLQATDSSSASGQKTFALAIASGNYDAYGGVTQLSCPNGPAAHFYTQKINGRWWLCTPAGNVFWLRGVYHVDASDDVPDYQGVLLRGSACSAAAPPSATSPCSVVVEKYGDTGPTWGPQTVRRLRSWGFNGTAEYGSLYVMPTATYPTWTTADHSNPEKMPFTGLSWPAHYARLANSYAQPVKNLVAPIKATVYTGYRAASPDVWDPNFAQFLNKELTDPASTEYAWFHSPHSDYLLGVNVDDTDELFGFGAGSDFPTLDNGLLDTGSGRQQAHLGWMVLVTAPTQSGGSDANGNPITYTDTIVYSKSELSNWLSARYGGSIASLNAAWGAAYTTFGSSGGWGSGTGLLDEDGTHAWVTRDPYLLTGSTAAMQKDLDDFLYHHASQYFTIVRQALAAAAPGILYLGPTSVGTWGTPPRRQILQAAGQNLNVIGLPSIPTGCLSCTDDQQRIDFIVQYGGDKPWIMWEGFFGQPDSYMSVYPAADLSMPQSSTQGARGQLFQSMVTGLLNAKDTSTLTFHIVGYKWWELYDNRGEQANWGLVTRRDNAYDGAQSATSPGVDSFGYPTGGEQTNYGNFLDAVTGANLGIYKVLLGLP